MFYSRLDFLLDVPDFSLVELKLSLVVPQKLVGAHLNVSAVVVSTAADPLGLALVVVEGAWKGGLVAVVLLFVTWVQIIPVPTAAAQLALHIPRGVGQEDLHAVVQRQIIGRWLAFLGF